MDISSLLLLLMALLLDELPLISAKYCHYLDSSGVVKNFQCHAFEICCGRSCCEQFTSFYRFWYFWLCVMLVLMFCSGGGYWYRRRVYQRHLYMTGGGVGHMDVGGGGHHPSRAVVLLNALNPMSYRPARAAPTRACPIYGYSTPYEYTTAHHLGHVSVATMPTSTVWSGSSGGAFSGDGSTHMMSSSYQAAAPPPSYSEIIYTTPTPPPTYSMAVARQTEK